MKRDHSSRAIPYYIYRPGMSMKFLQISYFNACNFPTQLNVSIYYFYCIYILLYLIQKSDTSLFETKIIK